MTPDPEFRPPRIMHTDPEFPDPILPYGVKEWEKLSIFLNFLISKLPAPIEGDLAKGILETIDMTATARRKRQCRHRSTGRECGDRAGADQGGGRKPESEMDKLSNIVKAFNDQFGGLFTDAKADGEAHHRGDPPKGRRRTQHIRTPRKTPTGRTLASSTTKRSSRVITAMFKDDAQLFKQFQDNDSFAAGSRIRSSG